jgi:putative ABC transport system substrate-binding protein
MISRRTFLRNTAIAIFAAPLVGEAQPSTKIYRIGFLRAGEPPKAWIDAFRHGLRDLGYVDGQNVRIDFRVTEAGLERLSQLAEELVRSKVDVIVASSGPPAVAAKRASTTVPVVFVNANALELGLVPSLGHPGGNLTGLTMTSADHADLTGKRLEMFRELLPKLRRVAVFSDRLTPSVPIQLSGAQRAAPALGLRIQPVSIRDANDLDSAFRAAGGSDGLVVLDCILFTTQRARLVAGAAAHRLPAMYGYRDFVEEGGLVSYGTHIPELYRRAAMYVDKILRGASPADLPIEQPAKFELVINLKTAKTLGLTIPPALLLRADQIIE